MGVSGGGKLGGSYADGYHQTIPASAGTRDGCQYWWDDPNSDCETANLSGVGQEGCGQSIMVRYAIPGEYCEGTVAFQGYLNPVPFSEMCGMVLQAVEDHT